MGLEILPIIVDENFSSPGGKKDDFFFDFDLVEKTEVRFDLFENILRRSFFDFLIDTVLDFFFVVQANAWDIDFSKAIAVKDDSRGCGFFFRIDEFGESSSLMHLDDIFSKEFFIIL